MTYNPKYTPNQIIVGEGKAIIVTGWTEKNYVAKKLQPKEYAAIANLYSPTRGINFLVRNLLLNPEYSLLLIYDVTKEDRNAKAGQCLHDFFLHGFYSGYTQTGANAWVIKSDVEGYIDIEISEEALHGLRSRVLALRMKNWDALKTYTSRMVDWHNPAYAKGSKLIPLEFPLNEIVPTVKPGSSYAHTIEGATIAETWIKIIHRIKEVGIQRMSAYDEQFQEIIALTAVVTDEGETLETFSLPQPNYLPVDREFLATYKSQMLDDAPKSEGVKYTYGQLLKSWFGVDQTEQVVCRLSSDPDSARAVMSLWDSKDPGDQPPCLNHIWLRITDNKLVMVATFRSNDMFSAWTANAYGLRLLQAQIRDRIKAKSGIHYELGNLITVSHSAHIYSSCYEHANKVIEAHYKQQKPTYDDPAGNFLIEYTDQFKVTQTTPGNGEVVRSWSDTSPNKLFCRVLTDVPHIQPKHAAYIGYTLGRLKADPTYRQDSL